MNHKRGKKRQRKDGWTSQGRLHKHERAALPDESRDQGKRAKTKSIALMAKRKPNMPAVGEVDWFVWQRYERMRDAKKAMKSMSTKRWQSIYYDWKIEEQPE